VIGAAVAGRNGNRQPQWLGRSRRHRTDGATVASAKNYTVVYNGGNTATDNSGTLAYVRVEFRGLRPIQDQEFNGFTFCAIGSGTKGVVPPDDGPLDDSYEFFGGGFDIDHSSLLKRLTTCSTCRKAGRPHAVLDRHQHEPADATYRRRVLLGRHRRH